RSIQQVVARHSHQKRTPDFHDKYGNAILAAGGLFCISAWTYALGSGDKEDGKRLTHLRRGYVRAAGGARSSGHALRFT
ncbi:Cytochrome c oxidase subunit 7B, mitochondrial, partial [Microtus ochrogaster]